MSQLQAYKKAQTGDYIVPLADAIEEESDDVFSSGFKPIDDALTDEGKSGFRPGDLIVISGRSGNGKTLFAQNLTKNIIDDGIPVLFFSYEVRINRIYADFKKMGIDATSVIYTPKKYITGDIDWIKLKIEEADKKYLTQIIVIDHLDFITSKNIKSDDHRRNEISNIINDLKTYAVDNNKIIILLAHVVKTKDSSLENEDIADSRSINNIADTIMFIGRKKEETGGVNDGVVKISKNRLTGKHVSMLFWVGDNKIMNYYVE